jgi:hypothetical protein
MYHDNERPLAYVTVAALRTPQDDGASALLQQKNHLSFFISNLGAGGPGRE